MRSTEAITQFNITIIMIYQFSSTANLTYIVQLQTYTDPETYIVKHKGADTKESKPPAMAGMNCTNVP